MTVPSFFTAARSSPSVILGTVSETTAPAVLRAVGAYQAFNANSVTLSLPAGTIAGDLVVIVAGHGYPLVPLVGWTVLQQDTGTWWSGSVSYKVMTPSDITAGSVTVTFKNSFNGCATIASYQNGASLVVDLVGSRSTSGGNATVASYSINFQADTNKTYLMFGAARANATVSFTLATTAVGGNGTNASGALGLYNPGANGAATEQVAYSASGNGNYAAVVSIGVSSGDPAKAVAQSTAISAASEGTRWAVGPLYFEMTPTVIAGVVGVGVVNINQTFGAAVLGTGTNNFIYRSTGAVVLNGATIATISSFAAGDTIRVAYHPGARLAWFAVNGGSWNNDGTANPATFVGGIDVSAFVNGPAYPACDFSVTGSIVVAAFAEGSFAYTPPTGYNSVEEVVVDIAMDVTAGLVPIMPGDNLSEWRATAWRPEDNHSRAISFPAGPVKVLAGEVQEDSVPVAGKLVRVYNKRTGDYVGEAITDGSGVFSIPAQDPNLPHFVVAFDDPEYNAKVYDNVMPA